MLILKGDLRLEFSCSILPLMTLFMVFLIQQDAYNTCANPFLTKFGAKISAGLPN
jgi:hypothetical protein